MTPRLLRRLPPDQAMPEGFLLRYRALSVVLPRRPALAALGLGLLAALVALVAVAVGTSSLAPQRALAALFGQGDRGALLLVQQIRLPRMVAGLLAGAGLGAAGCLTQTLARNRLATPDLLGVSDGATAAVVLALLGSGADTLGPWWVAPLGAVGTAALLVLLAGGVGGQQTLVVGIALSSVLRALTELAVSQGQLQHASALYTWSIGSLIGRGFAVALPAALGLAALLPLALLAGRELALLRFDQDTATALGLDVRLARLGALAAAVGLAGLAVGIGGPIGWVALAAPVLAGRLSGPAHVPLLGSALLGAALVAAADTLGRLAGPVEIPVGVVSSLLSGPFLLWVLLSDRAEEAR